MKIRKVVYIAFKDGETEKVGELYIDKADGNLYVRTEEKIYPFEDVIDNVIGSREELVVTDPELTIEFEEEDEDQTESDYDNYIIDEEETETILEDIENLLSEEE